LILDRFGHLYIYIYIYIYISARIKQIKNLVVYADFDEGVFNKEIKRYIRLDLEILIAAAEKKREKKSRCLSFGRIHA